MIEAFANVANPVTQDDVCAISITPAGLENEKVDDTKTMSPDKLNALRRKNIRQELEPQLQVLSLRWRHTAYKQGSLRGVISFVDLAKLMVASWKNCDEFSKNVFEQLAKEGREIREYLEELPAEPTKEPQAQVKNNEPSHYMKWFHDTKKLYPPEPSKKRQRSKSAKKAQTTKEDNTSASRKISPSQTYASSTQKSKISVKKIQTTNEKHIKSASKQISPSPICSSNKSKESVASSSKDDLTFVEVEGIHVEVADSMVQLSKKNQTHESAPKHYVEQLAKEGREIRAEHKSKYLEEHNRKLQAEPTKEPQAQVKNNKPSNYMKWFHDTKKLYPPEPIKKRKRSKSSKKAKTTKEDNTSPSQTHAGSTQKSKISVKKIQRTNEKHIKNEESVASSSKDDLIFVEGEGIHDVEVADSIVQLSKKNQTQESAPKHYGSRVNQMCALSKDTLELLARKNVPARNTAPPQADLADFLAKKKNAPAHISLPVHEAGFVHTTAKRGLIRPMNECFVSNRPNKMCALDLLGKMNMTAKNQAPIQEDHVGYLGKEKLPPYFCCGAGRYIEYLAKKNLPANVVASVQGAPTNNSGFVYVDRGLVSHNGDDFTHLVSDGSGKSSAFSSPQPIKPAVNVTTIHSTNVMLKSQIRELEGTLANERLRARVRELEVEISRTRAVVNLNSYPTAAAAARYHPEIPHGFSNAKYWHRSGRFQG